MPRRTTPPEAIWIARQMREQATRVRELASQARSISQHLQVTWEGNAKENFMRDYEGFAGQLDSLAYEIEQASYAVEYAQVDSPDP